MKAPSHLKRVIVDFKKLNNDILDLLVTKYPDGYEDRHIVSFKNAQNELIECVEVRTEDTLYLVKISKRLVDAMDDHDVDDEDEDEDDANYDDDEKDVELPEEQ